MTDEAAREAFPGHDAYYDRDGSRVSLLRWARLRGDLDYRVLAATRIGSRRVVTIWAGHDLAEGACDQPMTFETGLYSASGAMERSWPWATEAQALAGHLTCLWAERIAVLHAASLEARSPT